MGAGDKDVRTGLEDDDVGGAGVAVVGLGARAAEALGGVAGNGEGVLAVCLKPLNSEVMVSPTRVTASSTVRAWGTSQMSMASRPEDSRRGAPSFDVQVAPVAVATVRTR